MGGRLHATLFLASAAVWASFFALYLSLFAIEGGVPDDTWQRALAYGGSVATTYLGGVLALGARRLGRTSGWAAFLATAFGTHLVHAAFGAGVYHALPPTPAWTDVPYATLYASAFLYDAPLTASCFVAFVAVDLGRRVAARERQVLAAEAAARRAQVETLRHQLNPHFLFNTLNSLSMLIMQKRLEDAEATIIRLGGFLRRSLDADPLALVPLSEEVETAASYLEIERTRFGDRLDVSMAVSPEAADVPVPPFLLQPLLENVVKHAVARVARPVRARLTASVEDGDLHVALADDGPGLDHANPDRRGVGLRHAEARLRLLFGDAAELALTEPSQGGVCVRMRLPATGRRDA